MSYRHVPRGDFLGGIGGAVQGAVSSIPVVGSFLGPALGFLGGLFGGGPSPAEMAAAKKWIDSNILTLPKAHSLLYQVGAINQRLKPLGLYWYGPNDRRGLVRLPSTTTRRSDAVRNFSRT